MTTAQSQFQGDPNEIQALLGQIDQVQAELGSLTNEITRSYSELSQIQDQLSRAWGQTNWSGPERRQADSAFSAAQGYIGRTRGGCGQARTYASRVSAPLDAAERAVRSFYNRITG